MFAKITPSPRIVSTLLGAAFLVSFQFKKRAKAHYELLGEIFETDSAVTDVPAAHCQTYRSQCNKCHLLRFDICPAVFIVLQRLEGISQNRDISAEYLLKLASQLGLIVKYLLREDERGVGRAQLELFKETVDKICKTLHRIVAALTESSEVGQNTRLQIIQHGSEQGQFVWKMPVDRRFGHSYRSGDVADCQPAETFLGDDFYCRSEEVLLPVGKCIHLVPLS